MPAGYSTVVPYSGSTYVCHWAASRCSRTSSTWLTLVLRRWSIGIAEIDALAATTAPPSSAALEKFFHMTVRLQGRAPYCVVAGGGDAGARSLWPVVSAGELPEGMVLKA